MPNAEGGPLTRLGSLEIALADRLAGFWRGLAMFFGGALLSGSVIFFKDYPPRTEVRDMVSQSAAEAAKEDEIARTERTALGLRVQTLESQMGRIDGKLDTIVSVLGKDGGK